MKLNEIIEKYRNAFDKLDFDSIGEIVSLLNNESTEFKREALSLYKQIGENLFSVSRNLNNYNYKSFVSSIEDWEKEKAGKKLGLKTPSLAILPEIIQFKFKEVFVEFFNRHLRLFSQLKDFYLLKLQKGENISSISALILCCDASFMHPALNDLRRDEKKMEVDKAHVKGYFDVLKNDIKPDSCILLILTVTPNLNGIDELIESLNLCLDQFDHLAMIEIKRGDIEISEDDLIEVTDREQIEAVIVENSSKIFNNKDLTHEMQKLIKKFFSETKIVINYKILKPGASGSAVIEVQGFPIHAAPTRRFVIKISTITPGAKSKLAVEMENYKKYVKNAATRGTAYNADYQKTDLCEAIQYNYASSGSVRDAKSFAEIIKELLDPKEKKSISIVPVIDGLLSCELFENWNRLIYSKSTCFKFYRNYLKDEEKIFDAITEINDREANTSELISFYNKVKDFTIPSNTKICHGDLHSDNFFWDGENVTLIDFGHTGEHHCVVDHSFLEGSIRLKHFPRYIPLDELIEYDKEFLRAESFEPGFDLSFIKRDKLRELYRLIHALRVDSVKLLYDKKSNIEYLISIFLITFRQIQYYDLNQVYGLKLAALMASEFSFIK